MKEGEHLLQVECVRWFREELPSKIIFAIPNGGWRRMLTAIKLKQEGATAGVPDLFIPEPSQDKHGLWIEMKIKGGHLQDSQKAMIELLRERGYEVAVCFSFLEFRRAVLSYFGVDVNVGLSARDMQRKRFEEIKEELNKQKKTCKRQKKLM